jgi:hypothetical protein
VDAREALGVLGLHEGVDLTAVRVAYRGLVRHSHPDIARDDAEAHARTARLTEAYEVIAAFIERHGSSVLTPPAPPAPPPPPAQPEPAPVAARALDEDTLALDVPSPEAYALLYEAAGRIGEIAYYDRQLGILETIVRFEGGPSCSVVMTFQGRALHTEVFLTMESIESAPTPPIAPVIEALVAVLGGGEREP